MPRFDITREPFGAPDCESEIKRLGGEDEYRKDYFSNTKFNNDSLDKDVFLIVGRRGAGKTALSHFFSFQNRIHNAITIDIDEPAVFQQYISKVAAHAAQSREVAIPRLVKVWEYIIWSIIFHQLQDEDPRIKAACIFTDSEGGISHFISRLLKDFVKRTIKADENLSDDLENIVSNTSIKEAKKVVLELAKTRPIIIAFDTLENYSLQDESMMRSIAALIQFASGFTHNPIYANIHLKLFIMAEIFPYLKEEVVLNTLKFVKDEIYLHWKPKDLMRLVSWKFWRYLQSVGYLEDQHIDWDDHRSVMQAVWLPCFGQGLINGSGLGEMSFPYVLRHTQMRPRQLILLCNFIARASVQSGDFPKFSRDNLIEGISLGEERLAEEVFNSYQSVYPNAARIADALSGIPMMFPGSELDRRAKITASYWANGDYSLNNFRQFLAALGIVGRVRKISGNKKIIEADFEYALYGRLPLIPDDMCVIHPMFYRRLHVNTEQKLLVYPFPDHQDFRDLRLPPALGRNAS
jgi:hypothetical protein